MSLWAPGWDGDCGVVPFFSLISCKPQPLPLSITSGFCMVDVFLALGNRRKLFLDRTGFAKCCCHGPVFSLHALSLQLKQERKQTVFHAVSGFFFVQILSLLVISKFVKKSQLFDGACVQKIFLEL